MLLRSHLRYADGIPARSYSHFCAIARALDALGERWSLLLLREMFFGPKRFAELQQGLPGIGTGVLSQRLRELEQGGVIARRRLPPPAASVVYELTESGRAVDPILVALARWGMDRLDEPRPDDAFRVLWAMYGMRTLFDAEAAAGLRESYEIRIGVEPFHVLFTDWRAE